MSKTIRMQQAMPSKEDVDRVTTFVGQVEAILYHNCDPFTEEDIASDRRKGELLDEVCNKVIERGSLMRVVYAGLTALRGLCDPEEDAVAVHPTIVKPLRAMIEYDDLVKSNDESLTPTLQEAAKAARAAMKHIGG